MTLGETGALTRDTCKTGLQEGNTSGLKACLLARHAYEFGNALPGSKGHPGPA